MKNISILWLVEHLAREMDVACIAKYLLEENYGIDVTIKHIYLHANQLLQKYNPQIIVYPFFYKKTDLAIEDFIKKWPDAVHFNLAWEQLHYKAHLKIKAPQDEFVQKRVIHHAWGKFYRDFLLLNHVPLKNILLNGNPIYQLYKKPYRNYFKDRSELAKKYKLDNQVKWVFIPENYRWAFLPHSKIEKFSREGLNRAIIDKLKIFSEKSLVKLLKWCKSASQLPDTEIIFRPRPSTRQSLIQNFYQNNFGAPPKNLHFIKNESVREWIISSDLILSSISTSLIEAAIAGKSAYIIEPIPIPDLLYCNWYQYIGHIKTEKDFLLACQKIGSGSSNRLKKWAQEEMLNNGDPIWKLADFCAELTSSKKINKLDTDNSFTNIMPGIFFPLTSLINRFQEKQYFNQNTHEMDQFNEADIKGWINNWKEVLNNYE